MVYKSIKIWYNEYILSFTEVIMKPNILKISVGDIIEMKKNHPCGSKLFKILRVGSDIRIVCDGCGRDMVIDRLKLEKAVKKLIKGDENNG